MDCFLYDTDLRDEGINHTGPKAITDVFKSKARFTIYYWTLLFEDFCA